MFDTGAQSHPDSRMNPAPEDTVCPSPSRPPLSPLLLKRFTNIVSNPPILRTKTPDLQILLQNTDIHQTGLYCLCKLSGACFTACSNSNRGKTTSLGPPLSAACILNPHRLSCLLTSTQLSPDSAFRPHFVGTDKTFKTLRSVGPCGGTRAVGAVQSAKSLSMSGYDKPHQYVYGE